MENGRKANDVLSFTSLSFAHPMVRSEERVPLALPVPALAAAHERLRAADRYAFLLSTCLRVEIAWLGEPDEANDILGCVYDTEHSAPEGVIRRDELAFLHLCRIAAGLDTPLIGELEVLSQFRKAVAAFHEAGGPQLGLGRVLELAVGVGRAARRSLGDQPGGSLASVAAEKASGFDRVAIFGSGAMARAAAEKLDARNVTVFARRPGPVAHQEARPWEEAIDALATYPVVISTIPGKTPLFSAEATYEVLHAREEPLILIDLGMPPGFNRIPPDGRVRFMGVDEVASSVEPSEAFEAEECVARSAETAWLRLLASDRAGAVIAAIVGNADQTVDEEVHRFVTRLPLDGDPEPILRQLAQSVARRVLHPPISRIGSTGRGSESVELLADLFGVDLD